MSKIQEVAFLGLVPMLVFCSCRQEDNSEPNPATNPLETFSTPQGDNTMSDPYAGATTVSKDGVIILYLRGDEIVKDGSVVGNFDGDQVRKEGSIVGEIRGEVYRHEGSEVWKLDKGNLYPGTEIRLEGTIVGDIRSDGTIWREGASWGTVKPYEAGTEETMEILVALYYFSDYFPRD